MEVNCHNLRGMDKEGCLVKMEDSKCLRSLARGLDKQVGISDQISCEPASTTRSRLFCGGGPGRGEDRGPNP